MTQKSFTHRPAKSWLKIIIISPSKTSEIIASFLGTLTESGVECLTNPPDPLKPANETIVGYLADDAELSSKEKQLEEFIKDLESKFPEDRPPILEKERIIEEDWGKKWKEHFKPFKISPHLIIKPSWEKYQPKQNETVIEMDPGMAFGTGHHASTRLALEFCDSLFLENGEQPKSVLDIGSGTGILAMACALFGSKEVVAIDNDPDAVAAARTNILQNGLSEIVTATDTPLDKLTNRFDLVIANITADVLTELASSIIKRMASSANLILSGILTGQQAEGIKVVYEKLGLATIGTKVSDEWTAIRFQKVL